MGPEFFILVILLGLLLLNSDEQDDEFPREFRKPMHCERHNWVQKPNNLDDGYYTVCENCKFLADGSGYEEQIKE